jgi:hypothetical protein
MNNTPTVIAVFLFVPRGLPLVVFILDSPLYLFSVGAKLTYNFVHLFTI